ncbi:UDP-glucose 4-epimerase GalE [Gammaproteobacteria bacterium]|nr:UDP-glucose 4-epimerase GalE [Gammaproteobacteria bacterium]
MKQILVTGGAGYIGSHACLELLENDYNVIVLDNLCNSSRESIKRVEKLSGKKIILIEEDIQSKQGIDRVFKQNKIDAVIHFAGLKAVGESVIKPITYYQNNIAGTMNLLQIMQHNNVKNIVFSSSATVYGQPETLPIKENFLTSATNPYGRSKLYIEEILKDTYLSDSSWNISILRYFNPVGAHQSGDIGEDPSNIPNNLMPYISQVAVGKLPQLFIYGNDYATKDGTGIRDYIHVTDLAKGHLRALLKLETNPGIITHNLGTGIGVSVLEMVNAFEKESKRKIKLKFVERRLGDVAECFADPKKAEQELEWKAELDLKSMCRDAWRWQSKNPNGYS